MGKSMSTAKQVNRNAITQMVKETTVAPKSNQQMVHRAVPMPSLPDTEYLKKANNIDKSFNDRLKQVYVTSINNNPDMNFPKNRSMPLERSTPYKHMPHTQLSSVHTPNKLFIHEITELLENHKKNPNEWTVEYIAEKYDISVDTIEKLTENYGILNTFYGHQITFDERSEIQRKKGKKRIISTTTLEEMEKIVADPKRKWKKKEEFAEEWTT